MSTYTSLLFHIVFGTKYRQQRIAPACEERLYEYLGGLVRKQRGTLIQIGGMPDHVHILASLHPTIAISDSLRFIKTNSSKWFNDTLRPRKPFRWQIGFAAFSVSKSNVPSVTKYVANQKQHHQTVSFEDEYRALLIKHEIEFDEQYLFETEIVA